MTLLLENINPEPGLVTQGVSKVTGTVGCEVVEQSLVALDKIQGSDLSLERG